MHLKLIEIRHILSEDSVTLQTLIFKDERSRRDWQVSYSEQSVPFLYFPSWNDYFPLPIFSRPSYINPLALSNVFKPVPVTPITYDSKVWATFERNNISRQMVQLIHTGYTKYNVPVSCLVAALKSMQLLSNKMRVSIKDTRKRANDDRFIEWYTNRETLKKSYKYEINYKFRSVNKVTSVTDETSFYQADLIYYIYIEFFCVTFKYVKIFI